MRRDKVMGSSYGNGRPSIAVYGRGPSFSLQTPQGFLRNMPPDTCSKVLASYPFRPDLQFGGSVPRRARNSFRKVVAGRPAADVVFVDKSRYHGRYNVEVVKSGFPLSTLTLTRGQLVSRVREYEGYEILFGDDVSDVVREDVDSALGYAK